MKFDGNQYFRAVAGKPDCVQVGYLKAIWYYWNHNHCKGLENDSEFLRKVCEIDQSDWEKSMPVIFGSEFFTLDSDNLWQQYRTQLDFLEAEKKLKCYVERSRKALNERWKKRKV